MILHEKEIGHRIFHELPELFDQGDVIVLNNTKVIPARLSGRKQTGGKIELLLMNLNSERKDEFTLECLVKGKVKEGNEIVLDRLPFSAKITEHIEEGRFFVTFRSTKYSIDELEKAFAELIEQHGELPLPPYIKGSILDTNRYQTVYSENKGSIAAPTAGLHFTDEVLSSLTKKGVKLCYITLHISYGTFKPVREQKVEDHKMDLEYYQVSGDAADLINQARRDNCLTAVGTTCVRTLESIFKKTDLASATSGTTDLFIYPGYDFKSGVNRMLTNFHFPKSTLLMLVSAFAGKDRILNAYEVAKQNDYRFFSFGDAMLIINPR